MKKIFVLIFVVLSWNFVLGESRNLTLESALQSALQHNVNIQNAREGVEQARLQKKEAFASGLPVISGFVQNTHNFSIAAQPLKFPVPFGQLDAGGNPVPLGNDPNLQATTIIPIDVDLKFGQDNTAVYGLNFNQPLFEGRVIAAVRGAGAYQNIAKYNLQAARLQVIEKTSVSFYAVLLTKEALEVMQESLTFVKQNQQDTKALFLQGKATEFEQIRADVKVANQEAAVSNAKKGFSIAKAGLKRICGIPNNEIIEVQGILAQPIADIYSFQEFSNDLLQNQPLLKQVEESVHLAQENILLNKAEFMPSVYLTGSYQNILPYDNGAFDMKDFDQSSSIGISLSMPIFNGFGSTARVQKARSEYRKSVYLVEDIRESLLLELSNIILSLEESRDRIIAGEKGVGQAHRGVEIAQELYKKGMMSQLELMDANQGRNQAELGLLQAYFDYYSAKAALHRSINDEQTGIREKK